MSKVAFNSDTPEVYRLLQAASGKLCFDIGANGGFLAEQFSHNFDMVVAVVPCQESYQHLHALWHIGNLIPIRKAVSDHEGTVTLGVKKYTHSLGELFTGDTLSHWGPNQDTRTVACTTLDALAAEYGYPDFVKIDTEGHEWYIMQGGKEVFNKTPQFVIEVHSAENGEHIQDYLLSIFQPFRIVRHIGYNEDHPDYYQHYWIVG